MIRDDIKTALVTAMKGGDKAATGTIRLIQSALKNRDIELRTSDKAPDDDQLVTEVLQKMIKQRQESVELYEKGGRPELAKQEKDEIDIISAYLPKQMSDIEAGNAIAQLVHEINAQTVKDMGRVMAALKERYAGKLDVGKASAAVKKLLSGG